MNEKVEMEEEPEEDNTAVGFYDKDRPHFLPDVEVINFNSNTNFAANLIFADYFDLSYYLAKHCSQLDYFAIAQVHSFSYANLPPLFYE